MKKLLVLKIFNSDLITDHYFFAPAAGPPATGDFITFPWSSLLILLGGVLIFLSALDLTLTTLAWMAHETQYYNLIYNLGKVYFG